MNRRTTIVIAIVAAVATVTATVAVLAVYSHRPAGPGVSATLVYRGYDRNVSNTFWGVDAQTAHNNSISKDPAVRSLLNASAFRYIEYGQQPDQCDLLNNTMWSAGPSRGSISGNCPYNITAFKQWCSASGVQCHSIVELPGEIDDPSLDAQIASYIMNTLGFHPSYWTVGNEPTSWSHWREMWWNWKVGDASTPSAAQYASELVNVTAAVLQINSSAKFIGLEAACACDSPSWFTDVSQEAVDHPEIVAIAYHQYPTASVSSTNQSDGVFLQPLDSATSGMNLSSSFKQVWSAVQCVTCKKTISVEVDAYNHGSSVDVPVQDSKYVGALYIAASIAQAQALNLSHIVFFDLQTWNDSAWGTSMLTGKDVMDPVGTFFENVTGSFTPGGAVYNVSVRSTASNVWATMMSNAHNYTLLVANANTSDTLNLDLNGVFPGGTGRVISWAPGQVYPTVKNGVNITESYTVPAEGILFLRVSNTSVVVSHGGLGAAGELPRGSPLSGPGGDRAAWLILCVPLAAFVPPQIAPGNLRISPARWPRGDAARAKRQPPVVRLQRPRFSDAAETVGCRARIRAHDRKGGSATLSA